MIVFDHQLKLADILIVVSHLMKLVLTTIDQYMIALCLLMDVEGVVDVEEVVAVVEVVDEAVDVEEVSGHANFHHLIVIHHPEGQADVIGEGEHPLAV